MRVHALRVIVRVALTFAPALAVLAAPAAAAPPVYTPFTAGTSGTISQGQNYGGHSDVYQRYALDLTAPEGTTLIAPADGYIAYRRGDNCVRGNTGCEYGLGLWLGIHFRDGSSDCYLMAHLRPGSVTVGEGAEIRRGQVLGQVGMTGNTTGPHVHTSMMGQRCGYDTGRPWQYADIGAPPTGSRWISGNPGSPSDLTAAERVTATSWDDGRIDVFWRGADRSLRHAYWSADSGWHGPSDLGGQIIGAPAAASMHSGRIDVFARGLDNRLHQRYYTAQGWSPWYAFDAVLTSSPAVASWSDGRLDVFVRGGDNAMYQKFYNEPAGWSGWYAFGGRLLAAPGVGSWGPGRLDVFAVALDASLVQNYYTSDRGWSGYLAFGGRVTSAPTIASWEAGRYDLFVRAGAGGRDLFQRFYDSATGWSGWHSFGGDLDSGPAAVAMRRGRLDVFAAARGWLVQKYYDEATGGWSPWIDVMPLD